MVGPTMSEQTKAALDAAIAARIADECDEPTIVTGYVLHAAHLSTENIDRGSTGYFAEYADQQPFHVCVGLAHQLTQKLALDYEDDDD